MEEALEEIQNWEDLSESIKEKVSGPNQELTWYNLTVCHHAENRIRFRGYEYMDFYRDLIRQLRLKLEIFPYHLCRFLNFTCPFDYYIEMLCDLLRTQKSYDCLPTFTAADILRIVGIHRNSYTELLQKCKDKGWISKISRAIRGMLPKNPLSIPVEGWWLVFPLLHKKARKAASKSEVDCLHNICKDFANKTSNFAGQYDREALEGLYKAMVVEFDIEIETITFDLVREVKSFLNDRSGFGKHLVEILKLCETYKDLKSISIASGLRNEIVKDSLGILTRLGFLDVSNLSRSVLDMSEWHKSWQPLSDLENSLTSSLVPSYDTSNSEELIKVTLGLGKNYTATALKAVKDVLCRWPVEYIESITPAIAFASSNSEPVVFTNLNTHESPLYRLFKLKFCGTSPVLYLAKGYVLTQVPDDFLMFTYFLVHSENFMQEVHRNDLLEQLGELLLDNCVFVIPLQQRFLSIITIPLPIDLLGIKDRNVSGFLRDKSLVTHFEHFVGYIEIAALSEKNYIVVNQYHGIPMGNKDLALLIGSNLAEAPWFKYSNLDAVYESQQDEVFQYREFTCGVDVENGFIMIG
ncbi:hypothetical protein SteCoe_37096 [Stentor coeruleus]|uniref:FAM91 N-terminal domain-containing protein n=1 Tax=Stentor coeruleus TaxID=5963 RepID=A0A1R2ANS6_9CILI|nr:hypothetical protein SteCoe_37096 [Stentor coeruleus]